MAGVANVTMSYKKLIDLKIAVQDGSIKHIKKLLRHKGSLRVNLKDENEWSLLLYATDSDGMSVNTCNKIIKLLLKKGIEIDSQDERGWTALMIASWKGHPETVKLLLKHNANVDAQNNYGQSSLMLACTRGKYETLQVLIEHRANVNEQSKINGLSTLMIASQIGHTETVKLLLDNGARVNDQDKAGWCALMFASQYGHNEIIILLLESRIRTRYTIMTQDVHHERFSLDNHRAGINLQNKRGRTSLMIAIDNKHIDTTKQTEIVKCLLHYGADINIMDDSGYSAMDYAIKAGHMELVDLLRYRNECQNPMQHNDLNTIIQWPKKTLNVIAPNNGRSTFQHYSEYDHLPYAVTSLTSTKETEYNDDALKLGSTLNAANATASCCIQSRRYNRECDARGSFQRLIQKQNVYDRLTAILIPRLDHALDLEHCVISKEHIDIISESISEWEGAVAKQLGLSSSDITTINNKYLNTEPKLKMKAVLDKWKFEFGNNATYNNLICALHGTGCQVFVNVVKNLYKTYAEHVYQSVYFYKAKNMAQVPFLFHKVIECDNKGREYTIEDHDITVRIPEGIVPEGKTFHFEIGVAMYGPFDFPEGTQPISPILWICIMEENAIKFHQPTKKFQLVLPHFLIALTKERLSYHQVQVAKANHNEMSQNPMVYKFNLQEYQPLFASPNEYKSYVLVECNHCCFYCLQANQSPDLAKDTAYYLVRIESSLSSEITFLACFFLTTCIKAWKEQFPSELGYRNYTKFFKFEEETTKHLLKIKPLVIDPVDDQCIIILDPLKAEIKEADINFWSKKQHVMKLMHQEQKYPPRVKMTVNRRDQSYLKLLIEIRGGCESEEGSTPTTPLSASPTASGPLFTTEYSSRRVNKPGDKPKISDAVRMLYPLAIHWRMLGTLLEVKEHVLNIIRYDERRTEDRLREMLLAWLKQVDTPTTWNALADAVETIDPAKAREIRTSLAYQL